MAKIHISNFKFRIFFVNLIYNLLLIYLGIQFLVQFEYTTLVFFLFIYYFLALFFFLQKKEK